jgi:hypothetical protein
LTSIENAIGSDGADYIVASAAGSVIEGGDGSDFIKAGAGKDTIVFASTAAGNDADTISGFTFGAAGDVLNMDAFLGTSAAFYDVTTTGTAIADDGVSATGTGAIALAGLNTKVVLVTAADITAATVTETALFGAGKAFAAEGTTAYKIVLLVGETSGTDGVKAYYVTDGTGADDMAITLVGTMDGVSLANVNAANLF